MQTLTIGSGGDLTSVKELVLKSAFSDKIGKISFENNGDMITEINLTIEENEKNKLCEILSTWIMQRYRDKLLRSIIERNFGEFPFDDRKLFFDRALKRMESSRQDYFKTIIKNNLVEYFKDNSCIYVDGFVRFRVREYRDYIEGIVEAGVDDLLIEREYDEFISLIREFINEQKSEMDFLHVIPTKDKKYRFYNRFETDISVVCTKEFLTDNPCIDINYDDMLISTLILLVPKKIMLHKSHRIENTELLKTIKEIFGDKLILCKGCEFCNKRHNEI